MRDGTFSVGSGVIAHEDIVKGTLVCFYDGDLLLRTGKLYVRKGLDPDEKCDSVYRREYQRYYPNVDKSFVITAHIKEQWFVDINAIRPKYKDTLGRNINHSNKPNLVPLLRAKSKVLEKFIENPNGDHSKYIKICFFACRNIKAGESLRYRYNDQTAYFSDFT